jgi:hypothetical protein
MSTEPTFAAMEAYEYVKTYLCQDDNLYSEQDFRFIGKLALKYVFRKMTYFSFTLNVEKTSIMFCIAENKDLTSNSKFKDMPCYSFKIINNLTDDDKITLEKLVDRIKTMVSGLNNAVEKSILNIEEKFIIEHDTINFSDLL